jgi:hypothetical protein
MNISTLNSIVVICLGVAITYLIAPFNIAGDQAAYIRAYEILSVHEGNISEAMSLYRANLSGFEIVHFLYIYIATSIGLEKTFSIALANGLLAFLANHILVKKMKIRMRYSLLLIYTNYYTYALFFTLEKLKFGVFFLLIAFSVSSVRKKNYYLLISVLSHLQTVIILPITKLNDYLKTSRRLNVMRFSSGTLRGLVFSIAAIAILAIVFNNYFMVKVLPYLPKSLADLNYETLLKLGCAGLISCYMAQDKRSALIAFSFLICAGLFTEPQRFMMFGYGYFLYFVLTSKKNIRYLVMAFSAIYYTVTAIDYLKMLVETGG